MSETDYPNDRSGEDVVHLLATGTAGAVPVVGGILAGIIGAVWAPALERRRVEWLNQLSADVEELALDHEELKGRLSDEAVMDVALQAAEVAQRTRSEAKRRALRAAVVNTVDGREPDADRRELFVRLVDQLTEAHLAMLAFLADPEGYADKRGVQLNRNIAMGSMSVHIETVFPHWSADVYKMLVADLDRAGLTDAGSALTAMMTGSGTFASRIRPFGRAFLDFIQAPE